MVLFRLRQETESRTQKAGYSPQSSVIGTRYSVCERQEKKRSWRPLIKPMKTLYKPSKNQYYIRHISRCSSMVEHSFRKAGVEGPNPSIGFMNLHSLFGAEFFSVARDYLRKNFFWCIFWGIILQIAGGFLHPGHFYITIGNSPGPVHNHLQDFTILTAFSYLVSLSGTALLLLGFYFYVKSKHRHPLWCLFALFPILGWIVLILLKGKNPLTLSKENS